jgi:hypothetical protein
MERIFSSWAGLASHFIGECFNCAKPFIEDGYTGFDPLVRFVSAQLFIDCQLSSESVLLLVQAQKEWDADLISRAVMEGSLKYTYMLQGDPAELKTRAVEYWHLLPRFAAIRRSERAKRFLAEIENAQDPEWRPIRDLIMDDDDVALVRQNHNRQKRQELEEAWSFSGICRSFSKSSNEGLRKLVYLAHGYGMSSHLLHKDGDGVGIVWDRYRRDPEEQAAVRLAHAGRIVSDICAFSRLRLLYLLRACKQPECEKTILEIDERYDDVLFSELAKAGRHFTEAVYGGAH